MAKLFVTMVDTARTEAAGVMHYYVVHCHTETQAKRVAEHAEKIVAYDSVRIRAAKPKPRIGDVRRSVVCVSVHDTPEGWPD